ncbi:DUF5304 domain-containing protein [Streptomyces sp. NPDC060334]|uniref:DUF5304 domain-containing protein n=1 Tax=unclassified Streptomyces TaxID=2593676 RepID=UPI0006AE7C76|nr:MULTISPECIES: DUF5304 domain-containing protein [unclassified Streptomyces]KOU67058.1 hypothetical protein ADK55_04080 [Streptomyces sp. WM4235]MCX5152573.1 DUF5304 domain-containing protein [Streptomyces sp. NBC_00291]
MSEATDRPIDDDAWAKACAEDLAAEKERRRAGQGQAGTGTGSASEELFKLFEAVADKVSALNNPLLGAAAQGAVRQFVTQAKTAAKPVIERNPEVFDHLAAAGSELLAAYRSAVEGHERRWTRDEAAPSAPGPRAESAPHSPGTGRDDREEGPDSGPSERIDLD